MVLAKQSQYIFSKAKEDNTACCAKNTKKIAIKIVTKQKLIAIFYLPILPQSFKYDVQYFPHSNVRATKISSKCLPVFATLFYPNAT